MYGEGITHLLRVAQRQEKADLVLKGGVVCNVFTGEFLRADIAIADGTIAGVGLYEGIREIDISGRTVCPGFIDAHLHLESGMVSPEEMVWNVLRQGTTTLIADPHEAVNVAGAAGLDYMLQRTEDAQANVYFMLPSCVPAATFEDNGAVFSAQDMKRYADHPRVLGLGEVMDAAAVLQADGDMLEKLRLFRGRVIDGHAGYLSDGELAAYRLSGVATDHECCEYDTAVRERRAGMQILVREGSAAHNLEALVCGLIENGADTTGYSFCTDDKHIEDIRRAGHIGANVRQAIRLGLPPAAAVQMATINTARCYGLRHLGAIAPGYQADLVILRDLDTVEIESVWYKGQEVSDRFHPGAPSCPPSLMQTVRIAPLDPACLNLSLTGEDIPVIEMIPGQIRTRLKRERVPCEEGVFQQDSRYHKVAVLERHHASGKIGLGVVSGFGLRNGAVAATVAHDSHNLIVVGDNDDDMLLAIRELQRTQGGLTLVRNGEAAVTVPLTVMGLMSDLGFDEVNGRMKKLKELAHEMGVPAELDPFMTLSFLALPVIPEGRVTARGVYDVRNRRFCKG